ncbi:winged helix-turn-helix transcriptional regulator [Kineosporia sp. J2-2]|uniref:Winged helix-turn-helix transcriptional regulator n=1 Tax=Kineosporia corallincola TaxID=2835133 RepID=A0ABS5TGD8_9ACTN|nr:DUF5937 family protein [Kineosporia corallincola]MBT0769256.1 winged helix-turn-helix transcriptional regulator [Kineosporia corallincola]
MFARYVLAPADLTEVRFAISPLHEMSLSLKAFRDPGRFPLHLRWCQEVQGRRAGLDEEMLLALTNDLLWVPDLLTPHPQLPLTQIHEQLDVIGTVPPRVLLADIAVLHPRGLPSVLTGRPATVQRRVVRALRDYWDACLEPYWPRLRQLLEADVAYRGREIVRHGSARMFAGLSERIRLRDGVLEVRRSSTGGFTRDTAGRGLTLVPSVFTSGTMTPISPDEDPLVIYAARGVGTLWQPARPVTPAALAALIGRPRAGLLAELSVPASSTELAARHGTTPAAVNQHLRALRAGGLLTSDRSGRSVLYRRSDLGDALITSTSP